MSNIKTVILTEWIRDGVVIPASGKKAPLPVSPVKIADGTARRLLDQSRDEVRERARSTSRRRRR